MSERLVRALADVLDAGSATPLPDALGVAADRLAEPVILVDATLCVTYANPAARRAFAATLEGGPIDAPALPVTPTAGETIAPDRSWAIHATAAGCLVVHAPSPPGDDPASLRAALEREMTRRTELEILADASRELAMAGDDVDACFGRIADVALELLGAEGAVVCRVDDGDVRMLRAARGSGTLVGAVGAVVTLEGSVTAGLVRNGGTCIANFVAGDPRFDTNVVARWAVKEAMVAPMAFGDHLVGAIGVANSTRGGFSAREGELLGLLADRGAIAVHHAPLFRDPTRAMRPALVLTDAARRQRHARSVGELLPGVVHDLNNPLTGVSAFAELLQEDPSLDESAREAVAMIRKEALRAIRIIKDILHFARPATQGGTGAVDLNALVEATLRVRGYLLRGAGIQISTQLEPELPRVRGDAQQLQQAVMHLLANAEESLIGMPAGQRELRVSTARRGNDVVVAVADNGGGMSPETQRRMFEPFFTTRPADAGAGLGLSIASGIVAAHGGAIAVRSEPGAGARLEICFPSTTTVPVATPEPVP